MAEGVSELQSPSPMGREKSCSWACRLGWVIRCADLPLGEKYFSGRGIWDGYF